MSEPIDDSSLKDLNNKIQTAKSGDEQKPKTDDHHSSAQIAWRMVMELVVGIAVGFGIGYGLDLLLGTLPLFLIVFVLLGFAAGVKTMLMTAKEIQRDNPLRIEEREKV